MANPNDAAMEAMRQATVEAIEFSGAFIARYIHQATTELHYQPAMAYRHAVEAIKREHPDKARLAGL